jgi:colanic acid biosynthesis glycosyl transferase WcaI
MRICVLGEYFYPDSGGGSGTVLSKLVRCLKDQYPDVEIDVITSRNSFRGTGGRLPRHENWEGVHIRRLTSPVPRKKSMRRRLMANMVFTIRVLLHLLLKPQKYDRVLVVTAPSTLPLAASIYSNLRGIPYVYLVYDLYLDMALALKLVSPGSKMVRLVHQVQKGWFQNALHTIVLGRCMKNHVVSTYDTPPEKLSVIPIPADVDQIVPRSKNTNFRQQHNLSGFVVLYAGNFARYQDFDTLLDAAALLRHRKDITFVFVGDGVKRDEIVSRLNNEDLANVRLMPFVPEAELCDLLASADASLVTLERGIEGLAVPSKFYNIMASGRPTLACVPKSCEVALVVEESKCGLHVNQEDPQNLASAIVQLADNPSMAEEMGANGRRVCVNQFGLTTATERFYDIFRSGLQGDEYDHHRTGQSLEMRL